MARPCKVQRGPALTLVCPPVNVCAKLLKQLDNLEVATAGSCSDGDAQSRHIQGLVRRMGQFSFAVATSLASCSGTSFSSCFEIWGLGFERLLQELFQGLGFRVRKAPSGAVSRFGD
jgi:hypothetical protein